MNAIYILSDEAGTGKTALAVTLASLARREGTSVVVVNPFDDIHDEYYSKLLVQKGHDAVLSSTSDPMDAVADRCKEAVRDNDVLIVEGSAGVGIEAARELVDALDASVVGVTQHVHGKEANSLAGWPATFGDRLIGVVVNGRTEYQGTAVATEFIPALEALGIRTLGVVPEDREAGLIHHRSDRRVPGRTLSPG